MNKRETSYSFFAPLLFMLALATPIHGTIRIMCTAALIPNQAELRQQEYIRAITRIKSFGYLTYIVESCAQGPTFLDELTQTVYTHSNNPHLRNKGINEAVSMLLFLEQSGFDDDDMIVKVTGRYFFTSEIFINTVAAHPEADAVVRFDSLGQVCGSCYALRCGYFKEMLRQFDREKMERDMINIERQVANYMVNIKALSIISVNQLGITARVASNNFLEYF